MSFVAYLLQQLTREVALIHTLAHKHHVKNLLKDILNYQGVSPHGAKE